MSYLGIDIGTTGCKAVVFDGEGHALCQAYREYATISPQQGWFELDPRQVMAACRQTIAEVAKKVKDTDAVAAIGVSSQGEAFTLLDKKGNYLCNAMVSFDNRSQSQVREFTESFGDKKLYQITGHSAHTLFSLFKLLWIKQNKPDVFKAIHRLFCFGDLLTYELTGIAQISHNLASRTMLFDVNKCTWSIPILNALELDEKVLSLPVSAGHTVGRIIPQIAEELGLDSDTIVVTGGHDQCCGALGVGVTGSGIAAYSIGTVECVTPAFDTCVLNETMRQSNFATYPHTVKGLYTTVAFTTAGGSLLRWFRDTFCNSEVAQAKRTGEDTYELILKNIPIEPTSLFVLPHFASTGTPYFNPSPLGGIIGLSLTTTKSEIAKALLEGITYEMKVNLELLRKAGGDITQLRAFGGGAKSAVWMQIKADILNMPITTLAVTEAGCLGAAMLAANATGKVGTLQDCSQMWVKPVQTYQPRPEQVLKYKKLFEVYSHIYDSLRPLNVMMNKILY
jgi:xylulokinase